MSWIAWRMLAGNRARYFAILFGVTVAALLIAQQSSIFCGVMCQTASLIYDTKGADVWVMDPTVTYINDVKPMSENDLYRVRGVPGVAWAARLCKARAHVRLSDGDFQQVNLLGLDDATLVGAPSEMVLGTAEDLRQPDAVLIDVTGYRLLWPGEPLRLGKELEINDHRAVVRGIGKASKTFDTWPILYARYSQLTRYLPPQRRLLTYILAQGEPGLPPKEVCRRVEEQTGLCALTREEFIRKTMRYYLRRTGIPMNFGIMVVLGFLVGTAIAGQTFYLFTLENLRHFGVLKAMGLGNGRIVGMILLQAFVLGATGYALGVGLAALFGEFALRAEKLAYFMPWQVLVGTGAAVVLIVSLCSLLSIRRVLTLETAIVFRG
jgi:putative ABC transport system permease protein